MARYQLQAQRVTAYNFLNSPSSPTPASRSSHREDRKSDIQAPVKQPVDLRTRWQQDSGYLGTPVVMQRRGNCSLRRRTKAYGQAQVGSLVPQPVADLSRYGALV